MAEPGTLLVVYLAVTLLALYLCRLHADQQKYCSKFLFVIFSNTRMQHSLIDPRAGTNEKKNKVHIKRFNVKGPANFKYRYDRD